MTVLSFVLLLISASDPMMIESEALVYHEKIARDYVISELANKNKILNALKAREQELLQATQ
jgi:hypothetical protein